MDRSVMRSFDLQRDWVEDWNIYPFNIPAIQSLSRLPLHPKVTYLVGENGSGKSTLIEAMAQAAGCNPEGGSRNLRYETRPSHSTLGRYVKLVNEMGPRGMKDAFFLRAESFYNTATAIEETEKVPDFDTTAAERCTNNRTENPFSPRFKIDSARTVSTFSMSRSRPSRQNDSSACWQSCTDLSSNMRNW